VNGPIGKALACGDIGEPFDCLVWNQSMTKYTRRRRCYDGVEEYRPDCCR
jgi:hypothetical protein